MLRLCECCINKSSALLCSEQGLHGANPGQCLQPAVPGVRWCGPESKCLVPVLQVHGSLIES